MADPVVVVGGGIAGSATAAALGHVEVVLLDAAPHDPYDRPPLSKTVLVTGDDGVDLRPDGWWDANHVDLRTGVTVTGVEGRTVHTTSGAIPWSSLVLATGGRPRSLAVPGAGLTGVVSVNDLDGALACAGALTSTDHPAEDVVIVGAGFIGCEAAAAIRPTGRSVTVLEAGPRPLAHAVGTTVADWLCALHRKAGVDLHVGVVVESFEGDGRVRAAHTADGGRHAADLVIVAVGIELRVDVATSAGCTVGNAVVVDQRLRTSVDGILAVGDIARFPCRFAGSTADGSPAPYRCEHYNVTLGHGAAAARTILGDDGPYDDLPTYWTDQYDLTVNGCGPTELADDVQVRGDLEGGDFVAAHLRGGRLIAGLACGQRREYRSLRRLLQRGVPITSADLADPDVTFAELDAQHPPST